MEMHRCTWVTADRSSFFNARANEPNLLRSSTMSSIQELLNRLDGDQWRTAHAFSPDIKTACEVLLNPFARDDERKKAIRGWLTKNQPCAFGQIAAKSDLLFISIVDERLLSRGDAAVKEKLKL